MTQYDWKTFTTRVSIRAPSGASPMPGQHRAALQAGFYPLRSLRNRMVQSVKGAAALNRVTDMFGDGMAIETILEQAKC